MVGVPAVSQLNLSITISPWNWSGYDNHRVGTEPLCVHSKGNREVPFAVRVWQKSVYVCTITMPVPGTETLFRFAELIVVALPLWKLLLNSHRVTVAGKVMPVTFTATLALPPVLIN